MPTTNGEETVAFYFGKHKGKAVKDVPTDYLCWVACECRRIRPGLRAGVAGELRRRGLDIDVLLREWEDAKRRREEAQPPAPPQTAGLHSAVDRWYRQLVMDYHPDRGGSHEAMVAINDAHERLLALLGAAGATRAAASRSPF
jgi:uncharacterized protein (DUF3820 family)